MINADIQISTDIRRISGYPADKFGYLDIRRISGYYPDKLISG